MIEMIPISIFVQLPQKKQHMLNIGLIGNTEILEPFVYRLKENKNINVIGKASVGNSPHLDSFHFRYLNLTALS
jgi:hypothetical protein